MDETQRCGGCKVAKSILDFSPSYRGKVGTWCRACFAAHKRGERDTGQHEPQQCKQCGASYVPKQVKAKSGYCSRGCKDRARKDEMIAEREAVKPAGRICMHCGVILPQRTRADAIFCSEKCNYGAHTLQRKLRARTGDEDKPGYLRAFICRRDKWTCGICGEAVDPALCHPAPRCASLDHIVPVSHGGSNDLWNLRLTHLVCNLSRGNRLEAHASP